MPEGINDVCDQHARREVAEVRHELRNYMAVSDIKAGQLKIELERATAESKAELIAKHGEVKGSLDEIKSLLKWAGSLIVTLILGVLGWSLVQQVQNNEQQKKDLQSQIKLLEQQERTRVLQQPDQRVLPPSAAESTLSAERAR